MIVTVLKTTFIKASLRKPSTGVIEIFNNNAFRNDLKHNLVNGNYTKLEKIVLEVYNWHAPVKKRLVRAN